MKGLRSTTAEGVPDTVIDARLNDLVMRRNQVAHRGGNLEELWGSDDMNDAIRFVIALSTDIFSMVVGYYLKSRHGPNTAATGLLQVTGIGPFSNGKIVVVSAPGITLFVGQPIFVVRASGGARWGRIQSLQLNDIDHKTIEASTPAPNGIGVCLGFSCSAGDSLVIPPIEDDLVWAPQ